MPPSMVASISKIPVGTGVRKLEDSEEETEGNFGDFKIVKDEDADF